MSTKTVSLTNGQCGGQDVSSEMAITSRDCRDLTVYILFINKGDVSPQCCQNIHIFVLPLMG